MDSLFARLNKPDIIFSYNQRRWLVVRPFALRLGGRGFPTGTNIKFPKYPLRLLVGPSILTLAERLVNPMSMVTVEDVE